MQPTPDTLQWLDWRIRLTKLSIEFAKLHEPEKAQEDEDMLNRLNTLQAELHAHTSTVD